ncbi:hypothetical protein Prudu_020465 [Prunus dulcis]|uniref:Uncharacterized protein n=1 Tax=Prunus dulcis TaxID=3755 RepID=A0A4Y1RVB5_PRUDU|nr:hypothetical protein Prudu_020465 [Prunus dulcis]
MRSVSTARTQQAGPSRGQAAWDYLRDSAKFLVESLEFGISGPGIWMMSEQRRGPLWFSRNSGAGPVRTSKQRRFQINESRITEHVDGVDYDDNRITNNVV